MPPVGGGPPGTASHAKQREGRPAAETQEGRFSRDLAPSLELGEDMLSTLARATREAEVNASFGGSSSTGIPARGAVFAPHEGDRIATGSDGGFAAAFEKYRAGGRLLHQPGESRQQTSFSASDSAALLCSAVDLACLREGLQTSGAGTLSGSHLGDFDSSGVLPESHRASAETAAGKTFRLLGGTDLAALQTVMADLAAGERTEFAAGCGIFAGSPSGRGASRSGEEHNRAATQQQQDDDILSSSLFAKLLQECQASGCDLADLGGERQGRDRLRVKAEAPERGSALPAELAALLQQHHPCRLSEKSESSKRVLASVSSTACNSNSNSRRTSSCSPGADEDGSEDARAYKRRILEMHLLDQRRSSFAGSSRSSGSSELRMLAASLACSREGAIDALEAGTSERKQRQPGQEQCSGGDSPTNPMSPSYLAELQLIERVASGDPTLFNEDTLTASTLRGPLGYYSVCEGTNKEDATSPRLYPIVRGVSRDNTKKRWAVYWKGYRRYFYDKFFESCIEAYRRAVQFRQQATTAAAAVAATGNPAHLIAAGLHGSPGGTGSSRQQVKGDPSETVAAVLASAAAAVANQANGDGRRGKSGSPVGTASSCRDRGQDNDRTVVCLYKEAILFVLEDLRNNVLAQYLSSRAAATVNTTAPTAPHASTVELAAATTAKRLLEQLLLVHTNLVGNATSTAELQPSLMIVAPCLEDLKLPSQQTSQQQLLLLQSILAMHIQQLLLLSRYLNKGHLASDGDRESRAQKSEAVNVKAEAAQNESSLAAAEGEPQDRRSAPEPSASAVDVHA